MTTPNATQDGRAIVLQEDTESKRARKQWMIVASTEDEALNHPDVDRIGNLYTNRNGRILAPFLTARSRRAVPKSPARAGRNGLWQVTVEYGVPRAGGAQAKEPEPGEPPIDYWNLGLETVPVDTDAHGNPLTDASGRIIEGVTRRIPIAHLAIRSVVQSVNPAAIFPFISTVNRKKFRGAARHEVQCLPATIEPRTDGWFNYSLHFEFNILSYYFHYWDEVANKRITYEINEESDFSKIPGAGG